MSNVFANLPVNVNAAGAAVDTSGAGFERTITVTGAFTGLLWIEVSVGGDFVPVAVFQTAGVKTVQSAGWQMRARSEGASPLAAFAPNIDIGADSVGVRIGVIPAPAINAIGAPLDISEFGERSTIVAGGTWNGVLVVEASEDGVGYAEIGRLKVAGSSLTLVVTASFVRVRSVGASGTFAPTIGIGSVNDPLPAVPAESYGVTVRDDGQVFNVYVDGTNGDDANDGLTAATALQTIAEVRRKFPTYVFGDGTLCVVNLLNGNANAVLTYLASPLSLGGGGAATDQGYVYRGPQMIPAPDLATGPTTAALDGAPYRVDQAGAASGTGRRARFDFTGAAPGWTVGDLVGSFMRATRGGVLVTFEFPISENGADYFIIDSHVETFQILQTDTIEIVTPAVRIDGPANADGESVLTLWGKGVGFSQEIYGAPNDNNQPNTFERISFGTFESTGIYGLTFDRCRFQGQFGARFVGGTVVFNNVASNVEVQLGCSNGFQNFMRADDPGVSPINGDFFNSGHVNLTVATRAGGFPQNGISIGRCRDTQVLPPSAYLFERNVSCYGSTNSGINVYAGSCAAFAIGVLGTGNAVAGVRAHQNSTAYFYTSLANLPLRVTVTGAGDLKVGNGAAIAYGTGVGQFSEVAGYNNNFTRKNEGAAATPVGDASLIALDTTGGV